jgi:hypothetical protein
MTFAAQALARDVTTWRDMQVYRKLLLPSKKMPLIDPGKDE